MAAHDLADGRTLELNVERWFHAASTIKVAVTVVAPEAVALAFLFSAFVGIFFGLWPARRAAKLDPIESLRYE